MKRPPARLTCVPAIYHQTPEGEGVSAGTGFSRFLVSDADPDQVRMRLAPSWQELDTGRVPEVGLVYLEHQAPKLQVQPSEEERQQMEGRLIEVSLRGDGVADIFLLPGESTFFQPADVRRLRVRVRDGFARLVVSLIPR